MTLSYLDLPKHPFREVTILRGLVGYSIIKISVEKKYVLLCFSCMNAVWLVVCCVQVQTVYLRNIRTPGREHESLL